MKKCMRFLLLGFGVSWAACAGYADIWSDCQTAIDAGNRDKAKVLTKNILHIDVPFDLEKRRAGLDCINYAMDESYVYDAASDSYLEFSQADDLEQERQNRAERDALAVSLRKGTKEREVNRKRVVWLRMTEACHRLYKKHPDGEYPKLCVWRSAHAVETGHLLKRSGYKIANWFLAAYCYRQAMLASLRGHSRTHRPVFSKLRIAR